MRELANQLKKLLEEECELYEKMLDYTNKKTEVITKGQVKDLDKITQIEQALILKISKLEHARESLVDRMSQQLGIESKLNMDKLTEELDEATRGAIEETRHKLLKTLNTIKEKNDLNSLLINDSLEYINFNLDLLTSTAPENTYNGKVKKEGSGSKRNLFDAQA